MAQLEDAGQVAPPRTEPIPSSAVFSPVRAREWSIVAGIVIVGLSLWEVLARSGIISSLFFPPPSEIWDELIKLTQSGAAARDTGATLARVDLGFVLGGIPGLIAGWAMGYSRTLRAIADPFVAATHPIPKIALLPLVMLILGIGDNSRVALIAVATFYPMLLNAMLGVRHIHPIYFQAAENYGAGVREMWTRVLIPGSMPQVLGGARIALNIALLFAIAIEMVESQNGLGQMIWFGWETLQVEKLYVALLLIAVIGIAANGALALLAKRLTPWHVEREQ